MNDAGVGRLLVASLHQGIADLLPTRLEFYEAWLNPAGLREGRIGLAPLAAVLSFLRQEGEPYRLVAARAGEYAAEWMFADLPAFERRLVRETYGGSRAVVRWRKGRASVDLRGSIFCEVRDAVDEPLCEFYAAAIRRLMRLFNIRVEVGTERCRATGGSQCLMSVSIQQDLADVA